MNQIEALRLVKARQTILQHSKNFNMGQWVLLNDSLDSPIPERPSVITEPDCGTFFCIAGIIVMQNVGIVARKDLHYRFAYPFAGCSFLQIATDLIGIDMDLARALFLQEWNSIRPVFGSLKPTAQNAAKVIDYVLLTHGFNTEGEQLPQESTANEQ